jgi:ankyrin repeat protein
VACFCGFQEIVKYFINDCGCTAEVTDETFQWTPLHWACHGGHLEIIKYLASECKCNTEARDKLNHTPLCIASKPSHSGSGPHINTEVVSYLILEQGCDPEAEALTSESPLKFLYRYGQLSMIKHCIKFKKHDPRTWKYHVRPHRSHNDKQDSLHHTQSSTYSYIISPLLLACSKDGSLDVAKFLVEEYGLDPLERVKVVRSDTERVLQLTKEYNTVLPSANDVKTRLDSASLEPRTPLLQSCISGRLDMLQYLIDKCGQAVSHYYYHRLMIGACNCGHSEIMKYLLNYSTPLVENIEGNTLLHLAATAKNLKGAYETVKVLTAIMVNLDQRNCLGETVLHAVCKIHPCRPDIIELLHAIQWL